jgi:ligand-binding sensor domain-containing protein
MFEDVDGSLWVVMAQYEGVGPLCKVTDLAAQCFGGAEGMPFQRADSILRDGKGGFWIGTDTALVHWKAGHSNVYDNKAMRLHPGRDGIVSLVPNSDGSLWVGIARSGPGLGLEKFAGGEFRTFRTRNFDGSKIVVRALLMDSDQNLWVGTDTDGLYQIHGETVDHFGMAEGLSSDTISGLSQDREGVIWVATRPRVFRVSGASRFFSGSRWALRTGKDSTARKARTGTA